MSDKRLLELHPGAISNAQTRRVKLAVAQNVKKKRLINNAKKRKQALLSKVERTEQIQRRRIEKEEDVLKFLNTLAVTRPDTKKAAQLVKSAAASLEAVLKTDRNVINQLIELRKERETDLELTKSMHKVVLSNTLRLGTSAAVYTAVYPGEASLSVWNPPQVSHREATLLKTKQPTKHE